MAENGLAERGPESDRSPIKELLREHHDALWNYAERRRKAEQFTAADAAIGDINDALPKETHRFVAESNYLEPTTFFEKDAATGEYKKRNTILTQGRSFRFIGDRLEVVDGELVLVDSEMGGGINVHGSFTLDSLEDIATFDRHKDFEKFLDLVAKTKPGEDAHIDCMY